MNDSISRILPEPTLAMSSLVISKFSNGSISVRLEIRNAKKVPALWRHRCCGHHGLQRIRCREESVCLGGRHGTFNFTLANALATARHLSFHDPFAYFHSV